MHAVFGLADVGGGAEVVNGDVVVEEEAGELEELVEVALGGERDHYNHHLGVFLAIWTAVVLSLMLMRHIKKRRSS